MAYTAKTNWALDNIVLPADMNRIETGIKEAHDGVAAGGKFATPMKLSLAGGATGEVTFDGTQNVTLNVGVSATGHTHSNVTTSANGMMLSADKSKLDGIASGATRTIIHNTLTGTSTTEALSAAQGKALKDLLDGKAPTGHSHNLATTSSVGFMSTADKAKLDGIQAGATNTVIADKLTSTSTTSALSANQGNVLNTNFESLVSLVDNKAGRDVVTTTTNGLMSSLDKVKLNGIEVGATKTEIRHYDYTNPYPNFENGDESSAISAGFAKNLALTTKFMIGGNIGSADNYFDDKSLRVATFALYNPSGSLPPGESDMYTIMLENSLKLSLTGSIPIVAIAENVAYLMYSMLSNRSANTYSVMVTNTSKSSVAMSSAIRVRVLFMI